jgi:hypothetical protein
VQLTISSAKIISKISVISESSFNEEQNSFRRGRFYMDSIFTTEQFLEKQRI